MAFEKKESIKKASRSGLFGSIKPTSANSEEIQTYAQTENNVLPDETVHIEQIPQEEQSPQEEQIPQEEQSPQGDISYYLSRKKELLETIQSIEQTCEGTDNPVNCQNIIGLDAEKARLSSRNKEIESESKKINSRIKEINDQIVELSKNSTDVILEGIKNQRWFFFKNKPSVFFDKFTGLLWANLHYYNYDDSNGKSIDNVKLQIEFLELDSIMNWRLPYRQELEKALSSKSFPIKGSSFISSSYRLFGDKSKAYVFDPPYGMWTTNNFPDSTAPNNDSTVFPCSDALVKDMTYESDVANSDIYSEKEQLMFTLDLFTNNDLEPIFSDDTVTEIYRKMYIEKPRLVKELESVERNIEKLQKVTLISSQFSYEAMLSKYDTEIINRSLIKYYEALKQWCDELLEKFDEYEKQKEKTISEYNIISLDLNENTSSSKLSEDENLMLVRRQKAFKKLLSLDMNSVRKKINTVRAQAEDIEFRIDDINSGSSPIYELAALENEPRASFSFVTENTAQIVRDALKKIEYFEANQKYVSFAISAWKRWTDDFKLFKAKLCGELADSCTEDGIEPEIFNEWIKNWTEIRIKIEELLQPLIEKGLKSRFDLEKDAQKDIVEILIESLDEYKTAIDKFFLEERKGVYQEYFDIPGGELAEKFKVESSIYKITAELQKNIQEAIFSCARIDDRLFILKWAEGLLDNQIDAILAFISESGLKDISKSVLEEFAALKMKNYEQFISDANAYSKEKADREKRYNSLIFKMKKSLSTR